MARLKFLIGAILVAALAFSPIRQADASWLKYTPEGAVIGAGALDVVAQAVVNTSVADASSQNGECDDTCSTPIANFIGKHVFVGRALVEHALRKYATQHPGAYSVVAQVWEVALSTPSALPAPSPGGETGSPVGPEGGGGGNDRDGVECFTTPGNGTVAELRRQLDEQAAVINSLSPDEMLLALQLADQRRAANIAAGNKKLGYRSTTDHKEREAFRDQLKRAEVRRIARPLIAEGMPQGQATIEATAKVELEFAKLDATHALDWVAGGDGTISGMGNGSVNKSIGNQWTRSLMKGGVPRREQLRAEAVRAQNAGDMRMQVTLEPCE
jgi:hypothetical protein